MKYRIFTFAISFSILLNINVFSEQWDFTINSNLLATVNLYNDAWDGSEAGSASWTVNADIILVRQLSKILNNTNRLKLAFGQTYNQKTDSTGKKGSWAAPQKSTDLIDFESLWSFTLEGLIDPFISARIVSQFWDRSDPRNERYINPLEITESFGAALSSEHRDLFNVSLRLGGAFRQVINRDMITAAGGKVTDIQKDGGIELVSELTAKNKAGWLEYSSFLKIFEALFRIDAENDNYRMPDVYWENKLNMNLHKYIMLNLYNLIEYDKEISNGNIRVKNTFSAGFTFNFTNVEKEEEAEEPPDV